MKKIGIFCASSNKLRAIFIIDIVALMVLSLLCTACKQNEKQFEALEEMDTTALRKDVLQCIKQYVSQHKNDSAFVVMSLLRCEKDCYDGNEFYMINIADVHSFNSGEWTLNGPYYPCRYFKIGDKYVLVSSRTDYFVDQDKLEKDFHSIVRADHEDLDRKFFIICNENCRYIKDPFDDVKTDVVQVIRAAKKFTPAKEIEK